MVLHDIVTLYTSIINCNDNVAINQTCEMTFVSFVSQSAAISLMISIYLHFINLYNRSCWICQRLQRFIALSGRARLSCLLRAAVVDVLTCSRHVFNVEQSTNIDWPTVVKVLIWSFKQSKVSKPGDAWRFGVVISAVYQSR